MIWRIIAAGAITFLVAPFFAWLHVALVTPLLGVLLFVGLPAGCIFLFVLPTPPKRERK